MVSNALAARQSIDWSAAAEWTACIAQDCLEPIRDVFREAGAQGPMVIWDPRSSDMEAPPLAALIEYWSSLRVDDALPRADKIDPLGMRRALGYVMLVDAIENGRDFYYRLYGSAIAAVSGFDMTGRLLSDHAASSHIVEFALALYRATIQRRQPAFCHYAPAGTLLTSQWHRVALPLTDRSGAIVRLLAGAVPLGRDGRIVAARF